MKYIVVDLNDEEFLVMFPRHVKMTHVNMAHAVQSIKVDKGGHNGWNREFRLSDIVSAGFVDSKLTCHGRSESLNIGSRIKDSELLARQF